MRLGALHLFINLNLKKIKIMIRPLKQKDLLNFVLFCSQRDSFSDFYITKDNKRLFLNNQKIAEKVFNDCLKHGDKSFIFEEDSEIKGILLIVGYADKFDRKYIKVFAHEERIISALFKMLAWTIDSDLYLKIRKDNPILKFLEKPTNEKMTYRYFFILAGDRGANNERVLLIYKPDGRIKPLKNVNKDKDED